MDRVIQISVDGDGWVMALTAKGKIWALKSPAGWESITLPPECEVIGPQPTGPMPPDLAKLAADAQQYKTNGNAPDQIAETISQPEIIGDASGIPDEELPRW